MKARETPLGQGQASWRLVTWNAQPITAAAAAVLPCNGSQAWAEALAAARPFVTTQALLRAADAVWRALPAAAWQEAFDSHPRIGGTQARTETETSLHWSSGEQSAAQKDGALQTALAEANKTYEAKFGRVFLVCATGKGAAEILHVLQKRMSQTPEAEWQEAGEQQRRITQLRLRKWLGLPAVACDDV